MKHMPLVSIILPTKNNARTIRACLSAIASQTHSHLEVIFVDNFSNDGTYEIAQEFLKQISIRLLQVGPERNIQRHVWYEHAQGDILYFLDSDMYMHPWLLEEIVARFQETEIWALIVPEKNVDGAGYWTQVKAFERSLYDGDDQIEAARVFRRTVYDGVGGYDQKLISGEDWDLSERIRQSGVCVMRTRAGVWHDEGEIALGALLRKKFYYGSKFTAYTASRWSKNAFSKIYFFRPSFYTNWKKYLAQPKLFPGFLFMISAELIFGGLGFLTGKILHK